MRMRRFILTISLLLTLCFALPFINKANANTLIEIADVENTTLDITVQSSVVKVHVIGAKGQTLMIFNLAGVCVEVKKIDSDDRYYELTLPKGCYIVKISKVVRKIYIK